MIEGSKVLDESDCDDDVDDGVDNQFHLLLSVRYHRIKSFEGLQCINNNNERCSGSSR